MTTQNSFKKVPFLLVSLDDYVVFYDVQNVEHFYCMTRKTFEEKNQLNRDKSLMDWEFPEDITLKVFPVMKVSERDQFTDNYDLISDVPIDFPVNRLNPVIVKTESSN